MNVTPLLNSGGPAVEFYNAVYLFINPENFQYRFIEVAEEHVAKILQFIVILFLYQII